VAAEEAAEPAEDGESVAVGVVAVAGGLIEDRREKMEETPELAGVLTGGGEPGGVVLKGTSMPDRGAFSALTEASGFGRPVSSTSLAWIFDRFSSLSNGAPARFFSF